jgi:putative endonuclease
MNNGGGYYVYIVTNKHKTVLYTGVTNNLNRRIIEHYLQKGQTKHFTGRYHVYNLIFYEVHQNINDAIRREKEIKDWSRARKMKLIGTLNPSLDILNHKLFRNWPPKDFQKKF